MHLHFIVIPLSLLLFSVTLNAFAVTFTAKETADVGCVILTSISAVAYSHASLIISFCTYSSYTFAFLFEVDFCLPDNVPIKVSIQTQFFGFISSHSIFI